ncbi:MAG: metallophosphoesterase [Spirochaetales bacterium]|nr:metallophosphoesterase [Spirochaetales bacterium]
MKISRAACIGGLILGLNINWSYNDYRMMHAAKNSLTKTLVLSIFLVLLLVTSCNTGTAEDNGNVSFAFTVTADMRNYTGDNKDYFRGACETIALKEPGAFMISPGDIDPPSYAYNTIQKYIGADYPWYPVVGNHEAETAEYMAWLRTFNKGGNTLPHITNTGPPASIETTYSFDYKNAHFIILNEYFDGVSDTGTDGDVTDSLYSWLSGDLSQFSSLPDTEKPLIFVFGHEPAYPQADEDTGRMRHEYDSLNEHEANRDRFWNLLSDYGVKAYICGHTHNYSIYLKDSVYQIDAGHARGTADIGSPSTFLIFYVMQDKSVICKTFRLNSGTGNYELKETIELK